jgi:prophage endopeptidase
LNPYVIIGLIVAWLGSLGAVGWWQNSAGHTAERFSWQKRDNDSLTTANAKILKLEQAARDAERRHAEDLEVISAGYQKELVNAKAQRDRDVSAARSGALSLRFHAEGSGACAGGTGQTAAGAAGRDGPATAELPREVAAGLFAIADDADEVVRQLSACQAVIRADRSP